MSVYRTQALLDAPVEQIWELVGDPRRHPAWWPRVIDVRGERFDLGDEYVQVTRVPGGEETPNFRIEKREELREIQMRCQVSGTYAHWLMTEAQGGTFLDVELGMDPNRLRDRLYDGLVGRRFFRRWLEESVRGLEEAVSPAAAGR